MQNYLLRLHYNYDNFVKPTGAVGPKSKSPWASFPQTRVTAAANGRPQETPNRLLAHHPTRPPPRSLRDWADSCTRFLNSLETILKKRHYSQKTNKQKSTFAPRPGVNGSLKSEEASLDRTRWEFTLSDRHRESGKTLA